MSNSIRLRSLALLLFLACGCETAPPPLSYQEALAIHKNEVELLNSLKSRRLELSQAINQLSAGGLTDTASQLAGSLLGGAGDKGLPLDEALRQVGELAQPTGGGGQTSNPSADQAGQSAEQGGSDGAPPATVDGLAAQLSAQVSGQLEQLTQEAQAKKQQLETELASLDQEIVAQEAKVARALADKEAAEARR